MPKLSLIESVKRANCEIRDSENETAAILNSTEREASQAACACALQHASHTCMPLRNILYHAIVQMDSSPSP